MKLHHIVCLCLAIALPMIANAQIYKWKDKNGTVRYSDTPPPSTSIKADTIGKTGKDTMVKPVQSTSEVVDQPATTQNKALPKEIKDPVIDQEAEAARERASKAEIDKKNNQAKAEQDKINQQNCQSAKSNYQTFAQGGRILTVNEKGERQFLGDQDLAAGKAKAQAEMNKYCK